MGSELQHRIRTGCFLSRMTSIGWRPTSSGTTRSKSSTYGCKMIWPQKNCLWVLFLFIKLAVITAPTHLVLEHVNEPNTNRMIQCRSQFTVMGVLINIFDDTVVGLERMKNGFLTEWSRGLGQLLQFIPNPATVDSVLVNNMAVWSQSVDKYYINIQAVENSRPDFFNLELEEIEHAVIDDSMRRSHPDSQETGVVCVADWVPAFHWLQMRLCCTQARQMGIQASGSMVTHMPLAGEESQLEIERLRSLLETVHSRDPQAVPCNESEETMDVFGYFRSSTKETSPFRPPVSAQKVGGLNTSLAVVCSSADSCQDQCWRGSRSACWCDELCEDTGDCCCDRDTLYKLTQVDWEREHQQSTMATIDTTTAPSPTTSNEVATEAGESAVLNTIVTTSPPLCSSAGSCAGRDGGGSGCDCWCDDICDNTGDCCCNRDRQDCCCDSDQFCSPSLLGWVSNNAIIRPHSTLPSLSVCSLPCLAGSYAGRCGGQAGAGCWYDELCAEAGDSCCDREEVCYQGQQGWVDRNISSIEAPSHSKPGTSEISSGKPDCC